MEQIPQFLQSYHDDNILDVDLQMLQYWLLVAPSLNVYTFSTILFYKNGG